MVARRGVDDMVGVPLYFQSLEPGIAKGLGGRAGKEGTNCKLSEGQAQGAMDIPCHIKDCEWLEDFHGSPSSVSSDCLSRILYTS